MDQFTAVVGAFALAVGPYALTTMKVVDLYKAVVVRRFGLPAWTSAVAAFVVGVGIAVVFEVNLPDVVVAAYPAVGAGRFADGLWGQVLTGLGIGALASGWYERVSSWGR